MSSSPVDASFSCRTSYEARPRCGRIADGTSYTILLTEVAGRPRQWRAGTASPDQTVAGGPWAGVHTGIVVQGSSRDGATRPGPCAINSANDHEVYSSHPGGAHAVFADGSVRFPQVGMPSRFLAALVTCAGSEVISARDF